MPRVWAGRLADLLEAVARPDALPGTHQDRAGPAARRHGRAGRLRPSLARSPQPRCRADPSTSGRSHRWCADRGQPARLLVEIWPRGDPEVVDAVVAFCRHHAGFGPVAWEAPGFDSPAHTVRAMTAFEPDPTVSAPPDAVDFSPTDDGPPVTGLRDVAVRWVEFMDLQIWYLRHAFYNGVVPLLHGLGDSAGVAPWRLLFVERGELATGVPAPDEVDRRLDRYLAQSDYMAANGIRLRQAGGDLRRVDPCTRTIRSHGEQPDHRRLRWAWSCRGSGLPRKGDRTGGGAHRREASHRVGAIGIGTGRPGAPPYMAPVPPSSRSGRRRGGWPCSSTPRSSPVSSASRRWWRSAEATRLIPNGALLHVDGGTGRVRVVGAGRL